MASGDVFLLSDPGKEAREQTVKWSLRAIECAHDLEARAVVLHCGQVEMEPELEALYRFLKQGRIESEDVQGREDHPPPDQGTVDFTTIQSYLKDDTIAMRNGTRANLCIKTAAVWSLLMKRWKR